MTLGVLLLLSTSLAAPDFEVHALDGRKLQGVLVEVAADHLSIKTGERTERLPAASLRSVAPLGAAPIAHAAADTVEVELIDGSRLLGSDYRVARSVATLLTSWGEKLSLATRAIHSVRFAGGPTGAEMNRQWAQLVAARTAGDLLIVRKPGALDSLEGVARDLDAENLSFEVDQEPLPVKRAKIEGLVYYHPPGPALAEGFCEAVHSGGSRLVVQSAAIAGQGVQLTAPSGVQITWPLAQLARLDYSAANTRALGDSEPQSVEYLPYLGTADGKAVSPAGNFQRDRGLEQPWMQLGERRYTKGLAMRSRTKVVYRLPGKFQKFTALAGIDQGVAPLGHVQLRLSGDDKLLWEGPVAGGQPPEKLDVDIAGVRRLEIVADYGEDQDVADHLNLCNALLLK